MKIIIVQDDQMRVVGVLTASSNPRDFIQRHGIELAVFDSYEVIRHVAPTMPPGERGDDINNCRWCGRQDCASFHGADCDEVLRLEAIEWEKEQKRIEEYHEPENHPS